MPTRAITTSALQTAGAWDSIAPTPLPWLALAAALVITAALLAAFRGTRRWLVALTVAATVPLAFGGVIVCNDIRDTAPEVRAFADGTTRHLTGEHTGAGIGALAGQRPGVVLGALVGRVAGSQIGVGVSAGVVLGQLTPVGAGALAGALAATIA